MRSSSALQEAARPSGWVADTRLCGHEETLALIADFAGIVRRCQLQNARETATVLVTIERDLEVEVAEISRWQEQRSPSSSPGCDAAHTKQS